MRDTARPRKIPSYGVPAKIMDAMMKSNSSESSSTPFDLEDLVLGALGFYWLIFGFYVSILVLIAVGYLILTEGDLLNHKTDLVLIFSLLAIFLAFCQWFARGFIEKRFRRIATPGAMICVYSILNVVYGINDIAILDNRIGSFMTLLVIIFTVGVIFHKRGRKTFNLFKSAQYLPRQ